MTTAPLEKEKLIIPVKPKGIVIGTPAVLILNVPNCMRRVLILRTMIAVLFQSLCRR